MVVGEGTAVSFICQERLFTKQASGTTNASLNLDGSHVKKKIHWGFGREVRGHKNWVSEKKKVGAVIESDGVDI